MFLTVFICQLMTAYDSLWQFLTASRSEQLTRTSQCLFFFDFIPYLKMLDILHALDSIQPIIQCQLRPNLKVMSTSEYVNRSDITLRLGR